jgi:hypothetical protein
MLSELASSFQRALVLIGTAYLLLAVAIALALCFATYFLVRMLIKFVRFRGRRPVLCPEIGSVAIIRIDALHAAISSAIADPELQVSDCSRWPEFQGCRQGCLSGIPRIEL